MKNKYEVPWNNYEKKDSLFLKNKNMKNKYEVPWNNFEGDDLMKKATKLNLGSNTVKYKGFLNVDIRNLPEVDIVDNVFKLTKIKENSIDHIIAHNILEHIAPDKTRKCLATWVSKLKKGGIIEIGVPDGELIFERYKRGEVGKRDFKNCPWENVIWSIFGSMKWLRKWHGEDAELYMHHTLFCRSYLEKLMSEAGIENIKKVKQNHMDNITLRGNKK